MSPSSSLRRFVLLACAAAALAACGGDDDRPVSCDLDAQKASLRAYMHGWYLWSGLSPNPDPAPYATLSDYLDALRYGGAGVVPADRYSSIGDTASFVRFYGEGRSLGYGVAVNALEAALPLRIRRVEPLSPAAAAGLQRGDTVVSIGGTSAADLVASGDFSALSAAAEGEQVTIVVDRAGTPLAVTLTAAIFELTPVEGGGVITLGNGQRAGYLALKDFIPKAEAALATAFESIRAAGATELIVDLRYNGGGRVSVAATLAALIAGTAGQGQVLATLRYPARHAGNNTSVRYGGAGGSPFSRVVILTGPRTCSASELLINGLSPHMTVVTVGATTCGKPVGSNPVEGCGSTISAVNFDVVNSQGIGSYYAGLPASCAAAEDFTGTPGDPAEALTAAALDYLSTGACAVATPAPPRPAAAALRRAAAEPGEQRGMTP